MAKIGRPPKYNDTFPLLAEGYAREGMIDKEIWKKLGISEQSYYRYQRKFRQFRQSIRKGKAPVDFEVENALLKRAIGYEYEESMVDYKAKKDGEEAAKPISIRKTTKQVIPDVTAQKFWLTNRKREKWREKQETELSGEIKVTLERILTDERPKD